jgi:deoxyribose-phosphate aldolase
MNLGVTRIGATATAAIIDDFRARKAGGVTAAGATATAAAGASTDGGY